MDERLARLEAQLEQLTCRLAALEQRLSTLEAATAVPRRVPVAAGEPTVTGRLPGLLASEAGAIVALIGRTLVVLAGAYLLRALTDSGMLATRPGMLCGLAFALVWIVMAGRSGGAARSLSATFHGIAFVLIAFPLVFELTTRFHFLDPRGAAAGLGGLAGAALLVAAGRRLHGLAWVTTLGALATAAFLMLETSEVGPFAVFLVLLGVVTLWLGHGLDWTLLRWPVALAVDLAGLILAGRAGSFGAADSVSTAVAVQLLLLFGYLGSVAARTLFQNRPIIPFEVVQSAGAIVVGLGGAAYLASRTGMGGLPLGLGTLALAATCYDLGATVIERRQGRGRTFYAYTSAALVFGLAGLPLVALGPPLAVAYAALGLAGAWAGRLTGRVLFQAHGAVALLAAVLVSRLITRVLYGLGLPAAPDGAPSLAMLLVLALCVAGTWGLGFPSPAGSPVLVARVPRLVVMVLALGGLLGVVAGWLAPALAQGTAHGLHPGMLATLRTGLLVSSVLLLAGASRTLGFVEGAWLTYPLLLLTGLKFAFEDFRAGEPATLFLGFGLYGLALILGPWLCRRTGGTKVGC